MNKTIGLASILLFLTICTAHAQTPKEILAKSEAVYKSAKTYQAEYTQKMDNNLFNMNTLGKIQSQGVKYRLEITTKNKTVTTKQTMVCDGKTVTVYMPAINGYAQTSFKNGAASGQSTPLLRIKGAMNSTLKKLPDATIDGIPVYAIESGFNTLGKKGETTLFIDKKSYHLKRAVNLIEDTKFVETYLKETFNVPISPKVFVFTPPPGSKPLK